MCFTSQKTAPECITNPLKIPNHGESPSICLQYSSFTYEYQHLKNTSWYQNILDIHIKIGIDVYFHQKNLISLFFPQLGRKIHSWKFPHAHLYTILVDVVFRRNCYPSHQIVSLSTNFHLHFPKEEYISRARLMTCFQPQINTMF